MEKFDKNQKYPDSTFYYKNGNLIFEIEGNKLWVSYYHFWGELQNNYNMDSYETQLFIKEMVEKHFDWKGLEPLMIASVSNSRWSNIPN